MAGRADIPGVVRVDWYATAFRPDRLEPALAEIADVSLRYGATEYSVYRSRDDRYRFTQFSHFPNRVSWERYWYGREFSDFRAHYAGWYQIPLVYEWQDLVAHGAVQPAEEEQAEQDRALREPIGGGSP
jgi:hypothetical protein